MGDDTSKEGGNMKPNRTVGAGAGGRCYREKANVVAANSERRELSLVNRRARRAKQAPKEGKKICFRANRSRVVPLASVTIFVRVPVATNLGNRVYRKWAPARTPIISGAVPPSPLAVVRVASLCLADPSIRLVQRPAPGASSAICHTEPKFSAVITALS